MRTTRHHSLNQSRTRKVTQPVKLVSLLAFRSSIIGQIHTCDHRFVLLNETPDILASQRYQNIYSGAAMCEAPSNQNGVIFFLFLTK